MMGTRTRAVLAALPLAVMLALVGCSSGGGDDGTGVASAADADQDTGADGGSQGADGQATSPPSQDERDEMMLQYAQCLREHGVDVDDPQPGQGIQLQVGPEDQAAADEAMQACEEFLPPAPAPANEEQVREDMLAFAQCMRDNGVEAFADPKPGEGIGVGPEQVEDPDFEQAEETCEEEIFGGDLERAEGFEGSSWL